MSHTLFDFRYCPGVIQVFNESQEFYTIGVDVQAKDNDWKD